MLHREISYRFWRLLRAGNGGKLNLSLADITTAPAWLIDDLMILESAYNSLTQSLKSD